jgi:putative membrane protein
VASGLVVGAGLYALGAARLPPPESPRGRRRRMIQLGAYGLALATLVVALLSPLARLADVLFSAHMGQHELLMLVAAPLVVIAQPLVTALFGLPAPLRRAALSFARRPATVASWHALTNPVLVLVLHACTLWLWHVPTLFQTAMSHESLHAFQHATFFFTAALFWWAVVHGRYGRAGYGAAVLFVFATGLHSGMLGALFTFARRLWYPVYEARSLAVGVDPVEDQTLAGLIMWVPAGLVFMTIGLGLLGAWLGEAERRGRATTPGARSFES